MFPKERLVASRIKNYLVQRSSGRIDPNRDKFLKFINDLYRKREILRGVDEKDLKRINEHLLVLLQGLDRSSLSHLLDKIGKALKQRFGRRQNVPRKFFVFRPRTRFECYRTDSCVPKDSSAKQKSG